MVLDLSIQVLGAFSSECVSLVFHIRLHMLLCRGRHSLIARNKKMACFGTRCRPTRKI